MRFRILLFIVTLALAAALVAWSARRPLEWTRYTPETTRVVQVPSWPFVAGLAGALVLLSSFMLLNEKKRR